MVIFSEISFILAVISCHAATRASFNASWAISSVQTALMRVDAYTAKSFILDEASTLNRSWTITRFIYFTCANWKYPTADVKFVRSVSSKLPDMHNLHFPCEQD